MCFGHIVESLLCTWDSSGKKFSFHSPKNILEGEVKNSSQDAILAQKGEKGKKEGRLEAGVFFVGNL
jgi:hypothetical protein